MNIEEEMTQALSQDIVKEVDQEIIADLIALSVTPPREVGALPAYMMRTEDVMTSTRTCLPKAVDAIAGLNGIGGSQGELVADLLDKSIQLGVSSRVTGEKKDSAKIITEDIGLTKEEMKSISKRFAMRRYISTIDNEKEKDNLISNYDRAMKFVL